MCGWPADHPNHTVLSPECTPSLGDPILHYAPFQASGTEDSAKDANGVHSRGGVDANLERGTLHFRAGPRTFVRVGAVGKLSCFRQEGVHLAELSAQLGRGRRDNHIVVGPTHPPEVPGSESDAPLVSRSYRFPLPPDQTLEAGCEKRQAAAGAQLDPCGAHEPVKCQAPPFRSYTEQQSCPG